MITKHISYLFVFVFLVCAEVGSAEVFFMCRQSSKEIQISLEIPLSKISGRGKNDSSVFHFQKFFSFRLATVHQKTQFLSEKNQCANGPCHAFGFMYEFEKFPDFS